MVKICENCGGIIRGAGRKYCSYCRNNINTERRDMNILKQADKNYIKYNMRKNSFYLFLIELLIISLLYLYYKIKQVDFITVFYWGFVLILMIYLFYNLIIISIARREKENHEEEYKKYLRGIVEAHRDKRAFRNSILKE